MTVARTLAAVVLAAALIAGCGDDSDDDSAPEPRKPETVDSVPDLPPDWDVHVNRAGGFAFGVPPGWRVRDRGTTTEVRSFDGLVVLSVAADRTNEALDGDPAQAATRTLGSLPGFREAPEPGQPRELEHRYEAFEASATGRSQGSGVEQDLTVVVLRREDAATVTVLIAANADASAKPARRIADRVVATLRTQPPSAGAR